MSEYQRYEFLTADRPLTRDELTAVKALSSHINVSSSHALVEYNWGDFKHDPIAVLRTYFDGFLYWANWGAPQLALRFPRGILPANLVDGYDLDDFVSFTRYDDCDILDIHSAEMEAPDELTEYELGWLMPLREELMQGDMRALYIVWLAGQAAMGSYDADEEYEISVPEVPADMGTLTAAQQALAELLRLREELLGAAARHSASATVPSGGDEDVSAWIELLPPERRDEYLARLARNEPGLSRLLVRELRALRPEQTSAPPNGERVTYATLLKESQAIKGQLERERRERARQAHERHLKQVQDHQDDYWRRAEEGAERQSGAGYDQAVKALLDLRAAANYAGEPTAFQERLRTWVRPHLRRPALIKRLRDDDFAVPEA